MYRRDYILRLIERFAQALIALRNRILQRKTDGPLAMSEISAMAADAGLDLDIARQLDPASLLLWLSPTGDDDAGKIWLMAELLYLAGMAGGARGDLARARSLFAHLPDDWRPGLELGTAGERVRELDQSLITNP